MLFFLLILSLLTPSFSIDKNEPDKKTEALKNTDPATKIDPVSKPNLASEPKPTEKSDTAEKQKPDSVPNTVPTEKAKKVGDSIPEGKSNPTKKVKLPAKPDSVPKPDPVSKPKVASEPDTVKKPDSTKKTDPAAKVEPVAKTDSVPRPEPVLKPNLATKPEPNDSSPPTKSEPEAKRISPKRILMMPVDHGSHVNNFVMLANALSNQGHEILMLTTTRHESILKKANSDITIYFEKQGIDMGKLVEAVLSGNVLEQDEFQGLFRIVPMLKNFTIKLTAQAESFLSDSELAEKVKNYDLAIVDGMDAYKAALVLPYKYNIPYIIVTPRTNPWMHAIPILPSAEPYFPALNLDENSGVIDRLINTFAFTMGGPVVHWLADFAIGSVAGDVLTKHAAERPYKTLTELYRDAAVIMVLQGPLCMDYQRVSLPHYQHIGSIGASSVKYTKPEDMKPFLDFIGDSPFVLLTFGSAVKNIPNRVLSILMETFEKNPSCKFIVRNSETIESLPKNVKAGSWIPQNDLMTHPNIKLFITHGGNNGQMEAAYHGVPMFVLPLFADQTYNARRSQRFGTTEYLDFYGLTQSDFENTLRKMLEDDSYMKNAKKCSAVLKNQPSGQEIATFWVNHVLEFGSDHLQPISKDWPLYKLLMLDVFASVFLVIFIFVKVLKFFCRCCCRGKANKLKKE